MHNPSSVMEVPPTILSQQPHGCLVVFLVCSHSFCNVVNIEKRLDNFVDIQVVRKHVGTALVGWCGCSCEEMGVGWGELTINLYNLILEENILGIGPFYSE